MRSSDVLRTVVAPAMAFVGSAPYKLIDIGANLTSRCFCSKEFDEVIDRAKSAGVAKIIVTGGNNESCREALRLSRLYPNFLFFTAGMHPHNAKEFSSQVLEQVEEWAAETECVAIGECGLDFNRNFSPPEDQLQAFDAQVKLACRLKKPLFVHERDAHDQLKGILTKYKADLPDTVIHCFTGTADEVKDYLDMGFYIGLTGFLWKDRQENGVQHALKNGLLPLERLMVETDAPFLYPNIQAKRLPANVKERISDHARQYLFKYCNFRRNEPCSLPAVAELVAGFMNIPIAELAFATTRNAVRVFGLTI